MMMRTGGDPPDVVRLILAWGTARQCATPTSAQRLGSGELDSGLTALVICRGPREPINPREAL